MLNKEKLFLKHRSPSGKIGYPLLKRRARYPYIFIILFLLTSGYYLLSQKDRSTENNVPAQTVAVVLDIHDGDTLSLKIDHRVYKARLIGIDAPEMGQRPWGERAKKALDKMLGNGKTVFIETDLEKFDKYERLLVYLFTEEGVFINERMLLEGYAVLFTLPPNVKYVDRLVRAERKAKEEHRGIWGKRGLRERPIEYKEKQRRQSTDF
ncbi:MAG: thermonuclease family protein [Thermodesulfovibrionales bacterium]|nr:thermonuclease family protein [Thermodesulfovibrionales bacterium]